MARDKHYIKVFITDEDEGYVVNYDGNFTDVRQGADQLASGMGYDIKGEMNKMLEEDEGDVIYGFRIDYTITPIRTDPFK